VKTFAKFAVAFALFSAYIFFELRTLGEVPFHPDESSWILMSRDFDTQFLAGDTTALAFTPEQNIDAIWSYRLLNAPLAKHIIGFTRWVNGFGADTIPADFLWGVSWEQNRAALPRADVLWMSRSAMALLNALSALLMFVIGREIGGGIAGACATALFAFDPLMLLHNRRAMAEGALVLFTLSSVLTLIKLAQHLRASKTNSPKVITATLAGAMIALAICSKQTAIPLFVCGVLILLIAPSARARRAQTVTLIAFVIAAAVVWLVLNPIVWAHPLETLQAMLKERNDLSAIQVRIEATNSPQRVLSDVASRVVASARVVFFELPIASESPVYLEQLEPPARAYLAQPINTALRQPLASVILAALFVIGAIRLITSRFDRRARDSTKYIAQSVLLLCAVAAELLVAVAIPLAWQRYFVQLVPLALLVAAFGCATIMQILTSGQVKFQNGAGRSIGHE
jgi:4-amino-4-deoxy-L-arabinose transferase-like glycosyltransferase